MKMRICVVFLLLLELGISGGRAVAQEHASPADLVVLHGELYTAKAKQPWAEAPAIRGGKIIAASLDKPMEGYRGVSTQAIDGKGHLVLPGFVDTLTDKKYLAKVQPDRPVLLTAYDGHTSWASSK